MCWPPPLTCRALGRCARRCTAEEGFSPQLSSTLQQIHELVKQQIKPAYEALKAEEEEEHGQQGAAQQWRRQELQQRRQQLGQQVTDSIVRLHGALRAEDFTANPYGVIYAQVRPRRWPASAGAAGPRALLKRASVPARAKGGGRGCAQASAFDLLELQASNQAAGSSAGLAAASTCISVLDAVCRGAELHCMLSAKLLQDVVGLVGAGGKPAEAAAQLCQVAHMARYGGEVSEELMSELVQMHMYMGDAYMS
jgi:hypothetical protein